MKKILIALLIIGAIGFVGSRILSKDSEKARVSDQESKTQNVLGVRGAPNVVEFIPYWTFGSQPIETEADELLYFGISADAHGIITDEPGYERVSDFVTLAPEGKKKFLTVRMLDHEANAEVLRNTRLQQEIISDSIKLAQENGFDGIVLDLETSSISFDSLIKKISAFNESFYKVVHETDLAYYTAIYGDTYYRARPYDIKTLSGNADKILIMAYDFHKARGNPGPNFPLRGKEKYGYDFETMIADYLGDSDPGKLVPIFGMFGYDWEVDSNGKSVSHGVASSYNLIAANYITSCRETNCRWERDKRSSEIRATYTDSEDKKHIIWFEDPQSVDAKQNFLKTKGINSYGYWAYSYY